MWWWGGGQARGLACGGGNSGRGEGGCCRRLAGGGDLFPHRTKQQTKENYPVDIRVSTSVLTGQTLCFGDEYLGPAYLQTHAMPRLFWMIQDAIAAHSFPKRLNIHEHMGSLFMTCPFKLHVWWRDASRKSFESLIVEKCPHEANKNGLHTRRQQGRLWTLRFFSQSSLESPQPT